MIALNKAQVAELIYRFVIAFYSHDKSELPYYIPNTDNFSRMRREEKMFKVVGAVTWCYGRDSHIHYNKMIELYQNGRNSGNVDLLVLLEKFVNCAEIQPDIFLDVFVGCPVCMMETPDDHLKVIMYCSFIELQYIWLLYPKFKRMIRESDYSDIVKLLALVIKKDKRFGDLLDTVMDMKPIDKTPLTFSKLTSRMDENMMCLRQCLEL